jgi:hypothetical protein
MTTPRQTCSVGVRARERIHAHHQVSLYRRRGKRIDGVDKQRAKLDTLLRPQVERFRAASRGLVQPVFCRRMVSAHGSLQQDAQIA